MFLTYSFLLPNTGHKTLDVLLFIAIAAFSVLFVTYGITSIRFRLEKTRYGADRKGREPPTLPYWIPYIGHMLQMSDLHALYDYAASKSPDKSPVTLRIGSTTTYLIFGPDNVTALFKNSKHLERDNLTKRAFLNSNQNASTNPQSSEHIVHQPSSPSSSPSTTSPPQSQPQTPPIDDPTAFRIGRKLHDLQHLHLSQPTQIKAIATKFIQTFQAQLAVEFPLISTPPTSKTPSKTSPHPPSQSLSPPQQTTLFTLLKQTLFHATIYSLLGPHILSLTPSLSKIYWAYDEAFLLGLPELVYPIGNSLQDKLRDAVEKWISHGMEAYDWDELEKEKENEVWEENFGCRLFRDSVREMKERGVATGDMAGALLSLVWATASNSIVLVGWMVGWLVEDQELLKQVRRELEEGGVRRALISSRGLYADKRARISDDNEDEVFGKDLKTAHDGKDGTFDLDISTLSFLPFLNSLYTESLRFHSSVTVTRRLTAPIEIAGYTLHKGNFVMTPSYLAHMDPNVWGSRNNDAKSISKFSSASISTSTFTLASTPASTPTPTLTPTPSKISPTSTSTSIKSADLSTTLPSPSPRRFFAQRFLPSPSHPTSALNPSTFLPYGGGSAICPGRFLSQQQILSAVATMVLMFEMEFVSYAEKIEEGDGGGTGTSGEDMERRKWRTRNKRPEPDQRYAGGGVMPPDGEWVVGFKWRRGLGRD